MSGESVAWKGCGVGRFTAGGGISRRGSIFYDTAAPSLSRLNSLCGVFEYEVDDSGKTHVSLWEWK